MDYLAESLKLPVIHSCFRCRGYFLTGLFALALVSCSRTPVVHEQQLLAMGTLVTVSIYGADHDTIQQVVTAVAKQMHEVAHHWHAWKPGRLMDINRALEAGKPVSLTAEEAQVIREAINVSRRSDYLFDPAIGRLVGLWGFHHDVRPENQPPPSAKAVSALLKQHPSMADLSLNKDVLRSSNPAVELDFGGFAKGLAINQSIAALKKLGIDNAIVNAGGDMRVIGSKGGKPWRIGIQNPRGEGVIADVSLQGDESIYTSGDYERFFVYQGKRYHHIIDPRTGMPAPGVTSVTVISRNAALAEAADKALFIAGPAGFAAMAKQLGVTQAMLIDTQGKVYLTPRMAERLHFDTEHKPLVEVVAWSSGQS